LYAAGGSGMTRTANLFVEPRLASITAENYRLDRGSPLIDAADPTLAPTNDIDRIERPNDGDGDMIALPDIGAYEWPSDEVFGIEFIAPDTMTWQVEDPGDVYNVYRGRLLIVKNTGDYTQDPSLAVPERFCEVPASALPFTDPWDPGTPGTIAFYLVTLRGASVEGSLGNDWAGALRRNAHPCP